ncbi:MAG: DUF448 domain-containing protein [Mariprofundales bacterium]|nr:DUF448 domain-containing protein [Mariprofundales bacterium]
MRKPMLGGRHVPERSCDGCRSKMDKSQLLRLVVDDQGSWWPDLQQKAQGRGCYLCLQPECLARLKGKGFARVFGEKTDRELLRKRVSQSLEQRMYSLLHRLRPRAQIGRDAVMQGLWQRESMLLLVAADASAGLLDRITQAATKRRDDGAATTMLPLPLSSEAFGAVFDRDQVAVVGWSQEGLGRILAQSVIWLRDVDAAWNGCVEQ